MTQFEFIDLARPQPLVQALQDAERIGIDTEFMREKTYYAQLCLLQFSTDDAIWVADPLGADDLEGFWNSVLQRHWVLHSGRQDLEVVQQASGRLPASVFDTQVAAALLGYAPQMGYANLVAELFDVELPKAHTRADWSRRPLAAAELEYAADDVVWLLPACDKLTERLEQQGRLEWALEDCKGLLDPSLYSIDPAAAVERVKGARNMRGRARRAAVRLAAWREERAERSNKPRQWIMRDPVLLEIAASNPADASGLGQIDGIAPATIRRSADELLQILADADAADEHYEPPQRPDDEQKALLKRLQKAVRAVSADLDIAAEVLAPRRELAAAVAGERELRTLRGWRGELFGDDLLSLLDA